MAFPQNKAGYQLRFIYNKQQSTIMNSLLLYVCLYPLLCSADFPTGRSVWQCDTGTHTIDVVCFRPEGYVHQPILVVCHGVLRNAEEYADNTEPLARDLGWLLLAPRFDHERFPNHRYQRGDILDEHQQIVPVEQRTGMLVEKIVQQARVKLNDPNIPYYLLGHSAGGQFLMRSTAFVPWKPALIIAANSGTLLFPRHEWPYPWGLGQLPKEVVTTDTLKQLLAAPLVIYAGNADTQRDEYLDVSPLSDAQGSNRWERNRRAYQQWKEYAAREGWDFRWQFIEAQDVGHDHRSMFLHPRLKQLLLEHHQSTQPRE
ncbi:MAG: hypothetical protein KatS3mg113_0758 [Planctomycetaceae bacterium]|nr:MAG: hypothetical protein KatS3mg113_0758 [Planctomycetaceae bacterium]